MNKLRSLSIMAAILLVHTCYSQNRETVDDSTYYDFWVGEWYLVTDGETADEPHFVVKRGLYHSSFEEDWRMFEGYRAKAWRGWDSRSKTWDFAWMFEGGLFQIWEGRKVDGIWYIYKTFIIDGREVLSRQAFVPQNDGTMVRTSEHSTDDGKTWRLRFREVYKKLE